MADGVPNRRRWLIPSSIVATIVLLLACIAWPHWIWLPFPRPLFYHWVGASNTAYGPLPPFRDARGTWVYLDFEANLVVVFIDVPAGVEPYPPESSASRARFPTTPPVQIDATPNRLIIVTKNGDTSEFHLSPGESTLIKDALFEARDREQDVDFIKETFNVYGDDDKQRLREFLRGQPSSEAKKPPTWLEKG
jgi:hypothetical protein